MTLTEKIYQLREYGTLYLAPDELSEDEATLICNQYAGKVDLIWRNPLVDNRWQLVSQGWVGFVPLGEKRGISLVPKVPIKNLFKMLEYAYDLPSFKLLEGLYDCESIRDFYERLANILSLRT